MNGLKKSALERDFILYTRDAHFDAIPQLPKVR